MHGARSVLPILLLLAGSLSPPAHAQDSRTDGSGSPDRGFHLEQHYPNPVAADSWHPFVLEDRLFENSDSVVVSFRIYNILAQVVAFPVTRTGARGARERVLNLVVREPGRRLAYWDGKDIGGRAVPSGMYYAELTVNNRTEVKKIVVLRPGRGRSIIPRL